MIKENGKIGFMRAYKNGNNLFTFSRPSGGKQVDTKPLYNVNNLSKTWPHFSNRLRFLKLKKLKPKVGFVFVKVF